MMDMRIPAQCNLQVTSSDDPAPYYYTHLLRYPYMKRLQIVLQLMGERHFDHALDIGYGSGVFFPELKQRSRQLTGIDLHRNGSLVQGMMGKEGLEADLTVGDVCNLPFKNAEFDGVVCLSVLEFVEDLETAMAEIHRVMPTGGMAILGAPVLNRITGLAYEFLIRHMKHKDQHKSDHKRIVQMASKYFEIVEERRFFGFLPLDFAFFFCVSCRKV
jgi:ubiquinone/menaquinone biosynthesis C-methylase UbiE